MEKDLNSGSEAAHDLLMRLKHAVQSGDYELMVHLLAELYARYEGMLKSLIRSNYSEYRRILSPKVPEIIHDTFLTIVDSIENYEDNSLGISLIKAVCTDLTDHHLYELRQKKRKEHPLEPDAQAVELIEQSLSDLSSIDASPYIAEAERIIREARSPDLEKSQMIDVKSSPTTPEAGGETPAPAGVETMGGIEGQPIPHPEEAPKTVAEQRAELAKKFTYEDVSKIPPGVDPKQLDFLREAASVGAFEWVKDYTAEMIADYFTSQATYADIGNKYKITWQAVQERITRGMNKMRRILYRDKPELAEEDKYPLEQIKKGKERSEIFQTEKHKARRSQASKGRDHSKDIKRPGVEKLKPPSTEIFVAKPDLQ